MCMWMDVDTGYSVNPRRSGCFFFFDRCLWWWRQSVGHTFGFVSPPVTRLINKLLVLLQCSGSDASIVGSSITTFSNSKSPATPIEINLITPGEVATVNGIWRSTVRLRGDNGISRRCVSVLEMQSRKSEVYRCWSDTRLCVRACGIVCATLSRTAMIM